MSYHEQESSTKCKGVGASVVWTIDNQAWVEGNHVDMDDEKSWALSDSNAKMLTSGCTDVTRFGEAALKAAKKISEDNKWTLMDLKLPGHTRKTKGMFKYDYVPWTKTTK